MAHHRPRHLARHLEKNFLKSAKFWPVICLVGSRQVGKSTFLKAQTKLKYFSLDDGALAAIAEKNPSQLLDTPCIIDEAQKAPAIFDAVKLSVDQQKQPGKFILTGSVRFSKRTLIRESLTGRAKTLQMFPLTCSETLALNFEDRWIKHPKNTRVSRKDFLRFLTRGGMPAIFAARNESETRTYWNTLTESYVYRDLLLAVPKNPKPAMALSILKAIAEILALGELPTFARIFKKTGGTRPIFERHLAGLEDLMILHRIACFGATRTSDILLPFDSAFFLSLLGLSSPQHDVAIQTACIQIALVNEALAHAQASDRSITLQYTVSPKNEVVHLVTPDQKQKPIFWKIAIEPSPHDYKLRFLRSLADKTKGSARVLSSTETTFSNDSIIVTPWEIVL